MRQPEGWGRQDHHRGQPRLRARHRAAIEVALLDLDPHGGALAWAAAGRLPAQVEAAAPLDAHGSGRWPARAGELAGDGRLVVLDLPPLHMPTLATALMIADAILVPVTSSALGMAATRQTLRMIDVARASRRRGAPVALLVPNRVDPDDLPGGGRRPLRADRAPGAHGPRAARAHRGVRDRQLDRRACAGDVRGEALEDSGARRRRATPPRGPRQPLRPPCPRFGHASIERRQTEAGMPRPRGDRVRIDGRSARRPLPRAGVSSTRLPIST